jgi:CBS domain-containing protein
MQASEIMTRNVVSVAPDTSLQEVAQLLLQHGISAVPVVTAEGAVVGMVSEGDLIGRTEPEREARRDWWLALAAAGEPAGPDLVARLKLSERRAQDIMSAPVITVGESTPAREIASLLSSYRLKRVPVLRDGRLAGIVSRADVLRAFAQEEAPAAAPRRPQSAVLEMVESAVSRLDEQFLHHAGARPADAPQGSTEPVPAARLTADDFRGLVADFARREGERSDAVQRDAAERRREAIKELISDHIGDAGWQAMLQRARAAAENGAKETMLLRFPSDLLSDSGRAVNAPLPDWPKTLRGEAAETYLRFERELKPHGFRMTARVLDFPGGKPGDIGLFLIWSE